MIPIPYGKAHISCDLQPRGLLTSRVDQLKSTKSGLQLVEEAMANPIGSRPLHELAAGKRKCTIIISDHTRPVPSRLLMPLLLSAPEGGFPCPWIRNS